MAVNTRNKRMAMLALLCPSSGVSATPGTTQGEISRALILNLYPINISEGPIEEDGSGLFEIGGGPLRSPYQFYGISEPYGLQGRTNELEE